MRNNRHKIRYLRIVAKFKRMCDMEGQPSVILLNAACILRSGSSDVLFGTKQDLRGQRDRS
jgi:hypothetical protein